MHITGMDSDFWITLFKLISISIDYRYVQVILNYKLVETVHIESLIAHIFV